MVNIWLLYGYYMIYMVNAILMHISFSYCSSGRRVRRKDPGESLELSKVFDLAVLWIRCEQQVMWVSLKIQHLWLTSLHDGCSLMLKSPNSIQF